MALRSQSTVLLRAGSHVEPTPHFGPIRVLVADAFPPTRAGVRLALERDGCIVDEADSTVTALEVASRSRPDVCLIDTELPGGALAALSAIDEQLPGTAIVMFARSPSKLELLACVEAGAWGYLPKEMDPFKLSVALRQAVEGEAAVPRTLMAAVLADLREQARRRRLPAVRELTNREFEVLDLLNRGLTTGEIADRLFVAKVTVRTHVASIVKKLGAADRESAIHVLDRR